jgi:hypothetical protein
MGACSEADKAGQVGEGHGEGSWRLGSASSGETQRYPQALEAALEAAPSLRGDGYIQHIQRYIRSNNL